MRFGLYDCVTVKNAPEGGKVKNGDAFMVMRMGTDGDRGCYGVHSLVDGELVFLRDDEVEAATNGEYIRSMGDDALSTVLMDIKLGGRGTRIGPWQDYKDCKAWLGEKVDPGLAEEIRKRVQAL